MGRADFRGQGSESGSGQGYSAIRSEANTTILLSLFNGLRHSFVSYRVALVKNVAQVALEAGNSPQTIFSSYRELVTPQDARAWFGIVQPGAAGKAESAKGKERKPGKVIELATAVA